MNGKEAARHCAVCVHTVRNLSALSERQAEKVLKNRGNERLCVRYQLTSQGKIKFKESGLYSSFVKARTVLIAMICTFLGLSTLAMAEDQRPILDTSQAPTEAVRMGELPMITPSPSPTPKKELMGDVSRPKVPPVLPEGTNNEIKMGKIVVGK